MTERDRESDGARQRDTGIERERDRASESGRGTQR